MRKTSVILLTIILLALPLSVFSQNNNQVPNDGAKPVGPQLPDYKNKPYHVFINGDEFLSIFHPELGLLYGILYSDKKINPDGTTSIEDEDIKNGMYISNLIMIFLNPDKTIRFAEWRVLEVVVDKDSNPVSAKIIMRSYLFKDSKFIFTDQNEKPVELKKNF